MNTMRIETSKQNERMMKITKKYEYENGMKKIEILEKW
jgi:hypothetical protein